MGAYFLDTSALVKLYVLEAGSKEMIALAAAEERHTLAVLSVTPVEFRSAVRRRERTGDVAPEKATRILERFAAHLDTRFVRVSVNDPLVETALALVDRHALRAYDAIQLAGCLQWRSSNPSDDVLFACADGALLDAAAAQGMKTFDPAARKKVR